MYYVFVEDYVKGISSSEVISGGSFFDNGRFWQKSYKNEKAAFKAVSHLLKNFSIVHIRAFPYCTMDFTSR